MNEVFSETFYAATARPAPERRALVQDVETEVCVIGGGFAGLWTARALLARGQEVVLLEAEEVAGEASGRSGGFVSAGYAERLAKIVERVGLDQARELYALSRDGVEIVRSMLAEGEFGLDAVPGRLNVLRYDDEVGLRDEAERLARDFNHDVVVWPRERVREVLATDRYYQALHEADAFHLHPLNLARALAAEIESRGGTIYERSRVIAADLDGLRKSVLTEKGRVRAFQVVLAGSAFLGEAFPALAATVLPVRTHVAVTVPLGDLLKETIRYPGAIADTRRAGDYYRIIGERLLWGGRITTNPRPPKRLARLMAAEIGEVYPQLAGAPIDYAWSGTMGYAVHKMPQVGMVQPGVWIASAFGGHGLNTTAIAGELVASAMAEQDDRWRLFIPFGLVWAGGGAGRAATQTAYWSMQFKDWMDEVQTKRVEQVQADIAAGLAPGLAAFAARRAKRKFSESSMGRAGARFAEAIRLFFNGLFAGLLAGLRWTGALIYAISTAVGRVLYVVIMAVALVIGFVAGWIGWGMDMIAAGIVAIARATARTAALFWRSVVVPMAMLVAAAAKWAWQKSRLSSTRAALAIRAGAIRAAARVKAGLIWSGNKIGEGAIWSTARIKAGSIWSGNKIGEGAIWSAARAREGFIWCGARIRDGALWTAARAQAGAKRALQRGKQAALLSGGRAREGAAWTAARTKDGAVWSARKIADSSRFAWENKLLPGMKRAATGTGQTRERIKSSSFKFAARAREHAIAFGAWGAKLPRAAWTTLLIPAGRYPLDRANAVKNVLIDARKRHAEASAAARAARKQIEGEALNQAQIERQTKAAVGKGVAAESASAQEPRPPAKTWTTLLTPALDRVSAVKNVLIDARKRHAEASAAAHAARKEVEEEARKRAKIEREMSEAAEKKAGPDPASAEEPESPAKSKKKKKAKAKQDSVEA
jgi:glycine/D-amino acid oxidase-like deaminating enzyme